VLSGTPVSQLREMEDFAMAKFYCPHALAEALTTEPALGIGKLGSRLGPPIGGGLAQEHKKKSLDYFTIYSRLCCHQSTKS